MLLLAVVSGKVGLAGAGLVARLAVVRTVRHSVGAGVPSGGGGGGQWLDDLLACLDSSSMAGRLEMLIKSVLGGGIVVAGLAAKASSGFGAVSNTGGDLVDSARVSCAPGIVLVQLLLQVALLILVALPLAIALRLRR